MTIESPENNNEKEITKEEWNDLKRRADVMYNKVVSVPATASHFSHITRNRAFHVSPDYIDFIMEKKDKAGYMVAQKATDILEKYFILLDEFPDFKEKEMSELDGMFPDIVDTGEEALMVVDKMEERLRK